MDFSQRVLVIGGTSDTATVLKAVFEPRGATVERTRNHVPAPSTQFASEVVVIDLDQQQDVEPSATASHRSNRVLIGSDTPSRIAPDERFLAKPFHYPELVKMIEELLVARPTA